MQASVVICAVGRNRLLPWIIHSAVAQTVPADEYEVIVVEGESDHSYDPFNGESDVWRTVSAQTQVSKVRIRYLFVPDSRPGNLLHAARRAARGACMVMLPPDRVVRQDWLADTLYGQAVAGSLRFAE